MSLANTVSLNTNLNVDPFYDDFDEQKNFHRVLFRPGLAVQARELTTIQSILQNQIDRFAENIFREGSSVIGLEPEYVQHANYIRLRDSDSGGTSVTVTDFANTIITGANTNVQALVIKTTDGSEANTPHLKTLIVSPLRSAANGTGAFFLKGEKIFNAAGKTANIASPTDSVGFSSLYTTRQGILFAKDHFIRVPEQTIVLDKFGSNNSVDVGFTITESIVNSTSDTTLLDPAQGSFNYTAPGASRLKIEAILTAKAPHAQSSPNFVKIATLNEGRVEDMVDKPQYAAIRDYMAERTYDESGNYIVKGMSVRLRDHLNKGTNQGLVTLAKGGNTNLLVLDVEPGKAYVRGYDQELRMTSHVPTTKGIDIEEVESASISANYGNFVVVDEVAGVPDVNQQRKISLRSNPQNAVSNGTFSVSGAVGAEIGTARARALQFVSGNEGDGSAKYNLYLYDINMTASGKKFEDVKSFYYNNDTESDFKADIVLNAKGNANGTIQDSNFNKSVYRIPANNIKRLRDNAGNIDTDFQFLKKFDVTIGTDGTFTLATGTSDEQYTTGTGALSTLQKQANFYVTLNAAANSSSDLVTGVAIGAQANSFTSVSGAATKFNVGDVVKHSSSSNTFTVTAVGSSTLSVTPKNVQGALSSLKLRKVFKSGQVIGMGDVGGDGSARTITVASATSASFDIKEAITSTTSASIVALLKKNNGREAAKTLNRRRLVQVTTNKSDGTANTQGFNLGVSDVLKINSVRLKTSNSLFSAVTQGSNVTSDFILDNGQKDNFYDHGKLKVKPGSGRTLAAGDVYLVDMDFFTHDTSQGVGYFSVDSYPIDDTRVANNTHIQTQEIPIFVSPSSGERLSLRDSIDIRPRITDTATNTTAIGSVSTNPATSEAFVIPSGGLHFSGPNENFEADLEFYLPRKDLLVLESTGRFKVIQGVPSLFPAFPSEPTDAMTLAEVHIAPFPSLPQNEAINFDRPDLQSAVIPVKNENYTMRDIGAIKDRVDRLEYYASLSLLEMETKELQISDSAGLDRFKNGFLVDNFTGHNIGNVYLDDYKAAIDPDKQELRPSFKIDSVEMTVRTANSTNVMVKPNDATVTLTVGKTYTAPANNATLTGTSQIDRFGEVVNIGAASGKIRFQVGKKLFLESVSGTIAVGATVSGATSGISDTVASVSLPSESELITKDYVHKKVIQQNFASTVRNTAGLFYRYVGVIELTPDNDFWTNTTETPDVQVNFDNNVDNWQQLANAWGTQWNNWETSWTGQAITNRQQLVSGVNVQQRDGQNIVETTFTEQQTVEVTQRQSRTGVRLEVNPETRTQRLGAKVVDVNIQPFMRSRRIKISCNGLKPLTRHYVFMDDVDVNAFCAPDPTPTRAAPAFGTAITTDSTGSVNIIYSLPNQGPTGIRFRTGTKVIRVTDHPQNATGQGLVMSAAEEEYTSRGITQETQGTVLSTRVPRLSPQTLTQSRTFRDTRTVNVPGGSRITGAIDQVINNITQNFDQRTFETTNNFTTVNNITNVTQENLTVNNVTNINNRIIQVVQPNRGDGGDDGNSDPIAQTFRINTASMTGTPAEGVFVTKFDVFMQQKDDNLPLIIEIREVDPSSQYVTPTLVPFGRAVVPASEVNVSSDGSYPTICRFKTPVFLLDNVDYCVVVKPGGNSPNYRAFTARLGETDFITGNKINKQAYSGTFFASANDKTWKAIPEEDLKFNMYIAQFTTNTPGIVAVKNKDTDFLSIDNLNGTFLEAGEQVRSETDLTTSGTLSCNVGVTIAGNTSGATGEVTRQSGTAIRVKGVSNTMFQNGERINVKIGSTKQPSFVTVSSQSTPNGTVEYFDTVTQDENYLYIANTSGNFIKGRFVKGIKSGSTARIANLDNFSIHTIKYNSDKLLFNETGVTTGAKFALTPTTRDSKFTFINDNENTELQTSRLLMSRSNEANSSLLNGQSSMDFKLRMITQNKNLSPAIDRKRTNLLTIENLINNDSTGEESTTGGNAKARYITRQVQLAEDQDAEDLKVLITAYKPSNANIKVYYKIKHETDGEDFGDKSYVEMTQTTSSTIVSDNTNTRDFKEFEFDIPTAKKTGSRGEVQYTNSNGGTFTGYRIFAIKVVMLTTDSNNPPRLKDLRAIALQI